MSTTFHKAIIEMPFSKSDDEPGENSPYVGFIEGYASTSDLDREDDIITGEALEKASGDLVTEGTNAVYFNHRHDQLPIGLVLKSAYQRGKGIFVKIGIIVKEYWTAIKDRRLTSLSIYGRFKADQKYREVNTAEGKVDARIITKVNLYEVSVVTIPANPAAKFSVVAKNYLAGQNKDIDNQIIIEPVGEPIVTDFDEEEFRKNMEAEIREKLKAEREAQEKVENRIRKEAEQEAQVKELKVNYEELKELIAKANRGEIYQEPEMPKRTTTPGDGVFTYKNVDEAELDEFMDLVKILMHPGEISVDIYAPTTVKLPDNMVSWS